MVRLPENTAPLPRPPTACWRHIRAWVLVLLIGSTLGFPIAHWAGVSLPVSMVHGAFIGGLCLAFKHGLLLRTLRDRIADLPRGRALLTLYAAYIMLILLGIALALSTEAFEGIQEYPLC